MLKIQLIKGYIKWLGWVKEAVPNPGWTWDAHYEKAPVRAASIHYVLFHELIISCLCNFFNLFSIINIIFSLYFHQLWGPSTSRNIFVNIKISKRHMRTIKKYVHHLTILNHNNVLRPGFLLSIIVPFKSKLPSDWLPFFQVGQSIHAI